MEKLDSLVLEQLAGKVFVPERLQLLMAELRKRIKSSKDNRQDRVNEVGRQIKKIEDRQQRLLEAIETGVLIRLSQTMRGESHLQAKYAAKAAERPSVVAGSGATSRFLSVIRHVFLVSVLTG